MKPLRELAIALPTGDQQRITKLQFLFARPGLYLPIVIFSGILLILPFPIFEKIFFFVSFYIFFISCISYFYVQRKKDITTISGIVQLIRNDKIRSADQIQLHTELAGLELEMKQMYDRISNDIRYLKRLEQMRTEFLGNVSHELKTPLFTIQGYLETLQRGAINDSKVNGLFLEKAIVHTTLLSNLVHDLIDISQIESGEMRMSFRYFEVVEYLSLIIKEFEARAEEKGIEMVFTADKEKVDVLGDKARLRQVFTNLIDNAIKYTDSGRIEIRIREEKKNVMISVADTGIGLTETEKGRVFERFYRVDKARSKDVGGTGLGLAIVKHIVEAHHSKVEVSSEKGKGSTFSFRLKKY